MCHILFEYIGSTTKFEFFYVVLLISVEICNVILVNSMEQSLALAHADTDDSGKVLFVPWDKTDFRTGDAPWWS